MALKSAVSEHDHQVAVIKWFDLQYKEHRGRLFAIANGGQRHVRVAQKLKAEGVRRGVPDMFLPVPMKDWCGLFVELKREKGWPTAEQEDWIDYLNSMGYCAVICRGFDEAKEAITRYMTE